MKYRSYHIFTDYHPWTGAVLEHSTVELHINDTLTDPALIAIAEENAKQRLHSMVKRMPPRYWNTR